MRQRARWIVAAMALVCGITVPLLAQSRSDVPLVPVPPPPLGRAADEERPAPVPVKADSPPPAVTPEPKAAPTITALLEAAKAGCSGLDSYIVRLTRREVVGSKTPDPEQLILFKFRKQPWSVHLKWLSDEGKGREVVYVKGQHQGKIHSKLAAGDIPLMPAGKRLSLAPDNFLVRTSTRHPLTEAGILANVERLAQTSASVQRGDKKAGKLIVHAAVKRPEFSKPVTAIEHVLPPGADPTLPKGGKRTYFFQPDCGLPMLIRTVNEADKEVEYYRYDRLQRDVHLDDADFDPEVLLGKK